MPDSGPWSMHDGFGWWPLGGLMWLLVVGLAVFGAVVIVRRMMGQEDGSAASSGALRLLDERYTRGEIDREEYLRRRSDIVG